MKDEKKSDTIIPSFSSLIPHPSSLIFFILVLFLTSCHPNSCLIEPDICFVPPDRLIRNLPSSFENLSCEDAKQDWGKEMLIANSFARELDFYRAITGYKRAEFLLPCNQEQRRMQIEYNIILCYYLGGRYQEAIEVFEESDLVNVACAFPALSNLLILLYDAYLKVGNEERACATLMLIEKYSPDTARELKLSTSVLEGDIEAALLLTDDKCPSGLIVQEFFSDFELQAKSVRKAQMLNAVLPGAGYYYVGQKKAALTSFVINALFTAAAYQFFHKGYIAAGLITTSFEIGWYVGGINGAGLAAKAYNEKIYADCGKEALIRGRLFPILMFETAF